MINYTQQEKGQKKIAGRRKTTFRGGGRVFEATYRPPEGCCTVKVDIKKITL
jgi:hypothetical protein